MKKLSLVLVCAFAMVFAVSCAKKATPDACKEACAKQAELVKAAQPQEAAVDPVQKVADEYQVKMTEMQTAQGADIQAIQTECDTAAANLTAEADKVKATEDCTAKKNAKAEEWAPKFAELAAQKDAAVAAAQKAKDEAAAAAATAAEATLATCADECVKARCTEAKVTCQIAATNLDEFNACK